MPDQPSPLDLTLQYRPSELPVADGYAQRERAREDAAWQGLIGQAPGAAASEEPAAPEAAQEPQSILMAGLRGGGAAAQHGLNALLSGLRQAVVPAEGEGGAYAGRMEGLRKAVVNGALGLIFSPLSAGGAAAGQALANYGGTEAENAEVLDPGAAFTFRHLLAGAPDVKTVPPEQLEAWKKPMTARELVETLTPYAIPVLGAGARKFSGAVERVAPTLTSQRGSSIIGPFARGPKGRPGETAAGMEGERPGPATPSPAGARLANPKYIDATQSVADMIQQINTEVRQSGQAERLARGVQTQEMTKAKAPSALTVEELLNRPPGVALNAEQLLGARDIRDAAANLVDRLNQQARGGDPAVLEARNRALTLFGELEAQRAGASAETGRGLQAHKIPSLGSRIHPSELADLADRIGTTIDGNVLTDMIDALPRDDQKQMFARGLSSAMRLTQNSFWELWINSLLSGPHTHAAIAASNAMATLWAMPERALTALIDWSRFGEKAGRTVFASEVPALMRGLVQGWKDGIQLAGESLKSKELPAKLQLRRKAITGENWFGWATSDSIGLDPESQLGAFFDHVGQVARLGTDIIGNVIRAPGTAIGINDGLFRGLNYRMELSAQAAREASLERLTGSAWAERVRQIEANPPPSIQAMAQEGGLARVFNKPLQEGSLSGQIGQMGKAIQNFPMGRLVVPFTQTPINMAQYVAQRTPVLNLLSQTLRQDIAMGGAPRAMALGKIASGAAVAALVMTYVQSGQITGAGPEDKGLRADLRKVGTLPPPYAMKIGDEYYDYRKLLGPLGKQIAVMADVGEIMGDLPQWQADQLAAGLALGLARSTIDETWYMGLNNMIQAIEQPGTNWKRVEIAFAKSAVPALVRQAERSLDPTLRDVQTLTDAFRAGVPGWSSEVKPVRDRWGDVMRRPPGWGWDFISPVATWPVKPDPVAAELGRLQPHVPMPPRVLYGAREPDIALTDPRRLPGVKLTDDQYERLQLIAAKEVKDGQGRDLKGQTEGLINSTMYKGASDDTRRLLLQTLWHTADRIAEARLLDEAGNEQLKQAVTALREQKIGRRMAPGTRGAVPSEAPLAASQRVLNESLRRGQAGVERLIQGVGR